MPEGDTIHNHARNFTQRFVGRELRAVLRGGVVEPRFSHRTLQSASATGKHLRLVCAKADAPSLSLRVHLGIAGKWRMGAPDEFSETAKLASPLLLDFGDEVAFVYRPKQVLVEKEGLQKSLSYLGPDLLGDEPDYAEILRRARARHAEGPLGELLLDQQVAAGIGNVYKSELCFLDKQHPFLRVDEVDDAMLERIYRNARRLLVSNLGPWRRTTTADRARGQLPPSGMGRYWVYGRRGRGCYRCRTRIESKQMGPDLRNTFWCPTCQAP